MSDSPELLNVRFDVSPKEKTDEEKPIMEENEKEDILDKTNYSKPTISVEEQLTSVADPFEVQKPVQMQPQQVKTPEKPKTRVIVKTKPVFSKLTVALIVLIAVLLISIVVLLILKPGKLKREVDNMKDQYNESQKQLKEYQLQIQQLKIDNQELDKARVTAINQSNILSDEIMRMKEEDRILVKESEQFKKKPISFKDQKKKQYDAVANPTVESKDGPKPKQETVLEVPKFKDVADPDDDIPPQMSVNAQDEAGTMVLDTAPEEDIDIDGAFD